jgi:hypothetical protein
LKVCLPRAGSPSGKFGADQPGIGVAQVIEDAQRLLPGAVSGVPVVGSLVSVAEVSMAWPGWWPAARNRRKASCAWLRAPTKSPQNEIRAAVTDIGCSRKVNVQGVAFATESAYQDQLINQNAARLAQVMAQVKGGGSALARLVAQYGVGPR